MKKKLVLDKKIEGGELVPLGISEVRLFDVRVDWHRDKARAHFVFGAQDAEGQFVESQVHPTQYTSMIEDFTQYSDVEKAWENFQKVLIQRAIAEKLLPPGVDE